MEKVDGYTEDSDVPDFVLFCPGNPSSEQKADKELKELVTRRNLLKQRKKTRKAKTAGARKNPGQKPKSRSGRRDTKAVKKPSR